LTRLRQLVARREELIQRSAAQRQELTGEVRYVAATFSIADRVSVLLRRASERPALAALGVTAVLLLGPLRALRYGLRTYAAVLAVRKLSRL
jgi:hypothetical protein